MQMQNTNYWDILPCEIQAKIVTMATEINKQDLNIEIQVELLQELPSKNMWVSNPTMYQTLITELHEVMYQMHQNNLYMPVQVMKDWTQILDTSNDVYLVLSIKSVLNTWKEHEQTRHLDNIYHKSYLVEMNEFYFTNFMMLFTYQDLLSLKKFITYCYPNF